MTFDNTQPREADGKFGEKTGAAPDITLSQFAEGFPADATVAEQVAWALRNDAELTIRTRHNEFTADGLDLAREWNDLPLGAIPEVTAARLPEPEPSLSDEVKSVADKLRFESLDETGVTLADVSALRSATNRAEYRLLEYEAEDFLAKNHPEVIGLLISFDGYSGEPYIAGVETGLPEEGSGRNYGSVRPLTDGYEDISDWEGANSYYLKRFENEELFDEYGEVLIDDDSEYGEFIDPNKNVDGKGLGLQESARVYRFAERVAT